MPNKTLRELVSIKKGKQLNIEHMVLGGTFLVLNGGITPSGYTNDWNTEANTITISEGGNSCGYVSLVKQRFWSGGHNYTLNDCKIDKHYLYQYLKHKERQIMALRVGSGLPNIQMRSLVDFEVPILNEKEHYRFGSFLSAIDRLIEKQKEKVDRIKSLKKGYLQKTFDQKKNFTYKPFQDLMKKGKAGGTPTSTEPAFYDGGTIPFLSIADMTSQGKYVFKVEKKITQEGLDSSSAWLVPENSLIYSMYASVGKVCISKLPLSTSQAIFSVILKDNVDLNYVFYYLNFYEPQLKKFIATGTQGNISAEIVRGLEVPIVDLKQQQKIGLFLSAIDQLIEKEETAIERYESLKKGYLQRIFAD
jgi:type I restriction enzyme S subunit